MRDGGPAQRARHVLGLVGEHGVLDTQQVATLLGISRPTAHRLLDSLVRADLLQRRRAAWGRDHRWLFQLSWSGGQLVTEERRRAKQPALRGLFKRAGVGDRQHLINGFFVDLVSHGAGTDGRAGLVSWRHGVDARRWLAEHGAARLDCDGSGIWVEDGSTVRFVLLWLAGRELDPAAVSRTQLDQAPVDVVLVVTSRTDDELAVLVRAGAHPTRARLAGTTVAALADAGPAGAIWATRPHGGNRHRLADFGPIAGGKGPSSSSVRTRL